MENETLLARYGLFDVKVPRYTSYPPANVFDTDTGRRHQSDWLDALGDDPVSLYIHIPFCKRLCWFCACRTQGTKTLRPVDSYIGTLLREVAATKARLPEKLKIARLHLGGGTPTLLTPSMMERLLETIFHHFPTAPDFEFSVEIDPTEAAPDLLSELANWGMARASIGVQDFAQPVQDAIGRQQSFEQTRAVVDCLRKDGVGSVNIDLLYGLPHQSEKSLAATLTQVMELNPDRLALYGYAHVPHMSKRQVVINEQDLPDPRTRFRLQQMAREQLLARSYAPVGIDHFALPTDSMAEAARTGRLRRNFQGYTDDPCATLLGFGASAISRFPGGFTQNAVATAAYADRIATSGLAGHRGYAMSAHDHMIGALIEELMCYHRIDLAAAGRRYGNATTDAIASRLRQSYPDALDVADGLLTIRPEALSLTRIIATGLNAHVPAEPTGSSAI